MSPMEVIAAVFGTLGTIFGGIATIRQAKSTEKRTVADIYGEALDRLDERMRKSETRTGKLEALLEQERAHSESQDRKIGHQDRQIRRLRSIVSAWALWGQRLQEDWEEIRQNPQAPELPQAAIDDLDDARKND